MRWTSVRLSFQLSLQRMFVQLTMRSAWKLWILFHALRAVSCVTYLRPKNDKGPGTCAKCLTLRKVITSSFIHFEAATKAGVGCIEQVERYFFIDEYSLQVQNLAIYHSRNMSSPSSEIEFEYLFELHDRVLHKEEDEERFQLRVISETKTKTSVHELAFSHITLTDYYVVIADSMDTVSNDCQKKASISVLTLL